MVIPDPSNLAGHRLAGIGWPCPTFSAVVLTKSGWWAQWKTWCYSGVACK